ncbi:uncharacterized protein BT62DRAFT_208072 [Guyanagaster necrorhizus]|uniref:Uncharacterized protein n=1 Tax=Guyanagaster necrorhizus TaxID=856835 RepID=A0A9P7VQJ0_9AGAR|nr:uncharacterized protein BT62DRAFT_208072 [Guyanagaster necrorhizus MCA 3950]KAG7445059.1 hypothetical protein BT62DRAFT_208072 [Guyanagaster necrorhizus MCA 3950]
MDVHKRIIKRQGLCEIETPTQRVLDFFNSSPGNFSFIRLFLDLIRVLMPSYELPPLTDDLDLNNFETFATSSKRAPSLGPLWFIPPRYKPTRSNTRLDVISIRQARYRDCRPRAVPDQGSSSGEDSDDAMMDTSPDFYESPQRVICREHISYPAAPYGMFSFFFSEISGLFGILTRAIIAPRAFSSSLHAQQDKVHSMRPPFPSSSLRPASHRMLPPYAYEPSKPGRYQY